MAEDLRNQPRSLALKTGHIFFGDTQDGCDCLVWNICRHGALIEVERETIPPEEFRFILMGLSLNQLCEVVWRDGRRVGVKFNS